MNFNNSKALLQRLSVTGPDMVIFGSGKALGGLGVGLLLGSLLQPRQRQLAGGLSLLAGFACFFFLTPRLLKQDALTQEQPSTAPESLIDVMGAVHVTALQ